jgi:hypothetical protein
MGGRPKWATIRAEPVWRTLLVRAPTGKGAYHTCLKGVDWLRSFNGLTGQPCADEIIVRIAFRPTFFYTQGYLTETWLGGEIALQSLEIMRAFRPPAEACWEQCEWAQPSSLLLGQLLPVCGQGM